MKEIYVSLSAAIAQEKRLAMVANNLANVNTVGFKKDTAVFEVVPPAPRFDRVEQSHSAELGLPGAVQMASRQKIANTWNYARLAQTVVDFEGGDLRATNNPMDLAIVDTDPAKGISFFEVETPQGPRLTRMGNLRINEQQELLTGDGFRVLGVDGSPLRGTGAGLSVGANGDVTSQGAAVGSIKLVFVEKPESLEKVGKGLFADRRGMAGASEAAPGTQAQLRPGFLEMSNVNAVAELTRLIETQRAYGSYEKSIQSIAEISSRAISQAMNV